MSVEVTGFKSSPFFTQLKAGVEAMPAADKAAMLKKVNGLFDVTLKNAQGEEQSWTLEFKTQGSVSLGKPPGKPDVVLSMSDDTFVDLANGKLNGQKAFTGGKLKIKGNMMLATKLDIVLKSAKSAAPSSAPSPSTKPKEGSSSTSSITVDGFESSAIFGQIKAGLTSASAAEKEEILKKGKGIFQFDIKNSAGKSATWTLDLKKNGDVMTGALTEGKPDIIISVSDKDFLDLSAGKLNGQKAFMAGKLKVKGNMMLATKLSTLLTELKPKAKL